MRKNQVVLSGTCLSIRQLENGRVTSTLRVARADGKANYPRVVFEGDNAVAVMNEDLYEGDRIAIRGHMESFRVMVRGEYFYDYKIVVDEFEIDKFGKNTADRNEFVMEGPLRTVFKKDDSNLTIIAYDFADNEKKNSPNVTIFRETDYEAGDEVFTRGSIQTDRKKKNGKTVYYQTCVAAQTHKVS